MRHGSMLAFLGITAGVFVVGCASVGPGGTAKPPVNASSRAPSSTRATSAGVAAPVQVDDADAQGFVTFGTGARCLGTDNAEMFMRTEKSALVVCRSEVGGLYYRGYRIADGASIDLYDVSRQPGGFVAVNAPDNAQYEISANGFQLIQNGVVVVNESAIESGPAGWTQASDAQASGSPSTPPVMLGSASPMGPQSRGYGTEKPSVISMGSCANAISAIVWRDWGAPMAHGSGVGCVQFGQPPRYDLTASDLGDCRGVLAYRRLQIGNDLAQDICSG
jgi:hypothetical protein